MKCEDCPDFEICWYRLFDELRRLCEDTEDHESSPERA